MKTIIHITLFFIGLTLFSCKDKSSNGKDDKIKIIITETVNNEEAIYLLVKIDSVCAKNYNLHSPEDPKPEKQDTNVSLIEKLGGKETKKEDENEMAMKKAQREHPLFICLQPNIDQSGKVVPSSVVGRSLNKDTARVIDMIKSTNFLDKDIQAKWIPDWTDVSALILFKANARKQTIDNSSIDKVEYEMTEKFKNLELFRAAATVSGKLEYYLTIFPRQVLPLTTFPDKQKNYLFEIELNNKKYFASQPLDNLYKGIFIKTTIPETVIDSLKVHYPTLLIEKKD